MHSTIKLPNFSSQFARGSLEDTKLNWRDEEEKNEEKKEIIKKKIKSWNFANKELLFCKTNTH